MIHKWGSADRSWLGRPTGVRCWANRAAWSFAWRHRRVGRCSSNGTGTAGRWPSRSSDLPRPRLSRTSTTGSCRWASAASPVCPVLLCSRSTPAACPWTDRTGSPRSTFSTQRKTHDGGIGSKIKTALSTDNLRWLGRNSNSRTTGSCRSKAPFSGKPETEYCVFI